MYEFKRIVCPVDFSEASRRALELAVDLAARLAAEVRVIHVYQLPAAALPDGILEAPADLETVMRDRVQRQLDRFVEETETGDVEVSTAVCEGVPYVEIKLAAENLDADLVVIGTHGRTGLAHLLLGSVAERVVRTSAIPVLTVRAH